MRYVIYDTKNDYTLLSKEITFLEDYIKLMKTRLPTNTQVILEKQPNLRDLKIAPMLLLPLVENAFKHGVRATQPSYVYISVNETEKTIRFEIKNALFDDNAKQVEGSSGIGIVNTRRRLDLLYPDRYELTVKKDERLKEYMVTLILNTDGN
jgi:LytS/YehU family sensor histidine kinase